MIVLKITLPFYCIYGVFSIMNIIKNIFHKKIEDDILADCLIVYIKRKTIAKFSIKLIINYFQNLKVCGPILPCVQTVWEEARPNIILIHTNGARKGRPNIRCEGKQISEDSQPKNGQNYHPRRGGAYL